MFVPYYFESVLSKRNTKSIEPKRYELLGFKLVNVELHHSSRPNQTADAA